MTKILATLLATTVIAFTAAPAMAVDTSISPKCGPDAPEVYKRPGGLCEQIGSNQSQASERNEGQEFYYVPVLVGPTASTD